MATNKTAFTIDRDYVWFSVPARMDAQAFARKVGGWVTRKRKGASGEAAVFAKRDSMAVKPESVAAKSRLALDKLLPRDASACAEIRAARAAKRERKAGAKAAPKAAPKATRKPKAKAAKQPLVRRADAAALDALLALDEAKLEKLLKLAAVL